MISTFLISSANSRKFFVDVYTGTSIVSFEFESLDSALFVIETFVIKAQTISVYSYIINPYNHGSENIFKVTSQNYLAGLVPRRYRRLRGLFLPKNDKSFSCYWPSRQYCGDLSQRESGRYCYRRPRARESKTKK